MGEIIAGTPGLLSVRLKHLDFISKNHDISNFRD